MTRRSILILLATLAGASSGASAAGGDLWAVTGSGGASSDLYKVDKYSGASTYVGSTGYTHVTGLAFDPTSGILYGHANGWGSSGLGRLLQIDTSTGAATPIGSDTGIQSPDMDFDSSGQLYAWAEGSSSGYYDGLARIDKSNGTSSQVGSYGWGTALTGLGYDSTTGTMWLKNGGQFLTMNTSTGDPSYVSSYGTTLHNALDFDPTTGQGYSIQRSGGTTYLMGVDPTTGGTATIGDMGVGSVAALAFEVPAPGSLALLGLGGLAASRRRRA